MEVSDIKCMTAASREKVEKKKEEMKTGYSPRADYDERTEYLIKVILEEERVDHTKSLYEKRAEKVPLCHPTADSASGGAAGGAWN